MMFDRELWAKQSLQKMQDRITEQQQKIAKEFPSKSSFFTQIKAYLAYLMVKKK